MYGQRREENEETATTDVPSERPPELREYSEAYEADEEEGYGEGVLALGKRDERGRERKVKKSFSNQQQRLGRP